MERLNFMFFNITYQYETCQKQPIQLFQGKTIYQKYSKPKQPFSTEHMKPAYEYDY